MKTMAIGRLADELLCNNECNSRVCYFILRTKVWWLVFLTLGIGLLLPFPASGQWASVYVPPYGGYANYVQPTENGGYIVAAGIYPFSGADAADHANVAFLKLDSSGEIEWQRTCNGAYFDFVECIQQTSDGGYIAAGSTESFIPSPDGVKKDAWIVKLSSDGNIEWQKRYGGVGSDYFWDIKQTTDGGYIAVGGTDSFGAGDYDVWVVKLDSTGGVEWQKTYGENLTDKGHSIQQTQDGGYAIAGYYTPLSGDRHTDAWVLKLDASGNVQWQEVYGGSQSDTANSVDQTLDGGFIIAGSTLSFGAGSWDGWLLKLDANGTVEWQKTYGGSGWDSFLSVLQNSDGSYIVAGSTRSFRNGSNDAWVLKLDANGNIEWQNAYGSNDYDESNCIQRTADGYVVSGSTEIFGFGQEELLILNLSSDGGLPPDCTLVEATSATAQPCTATAMSTNTSPQVSVTTPANTYATAVDANIGVEPLCWSEPNRTITVTTPDGGESWQVGSEHDITWTSSNAGDNVILEYSSDSGSTWHSIIDSTLNDGSYSWTVPDDPSGQCLVRITSKMYGDVFDTSNANFTIWKTRNIALTVPNGGQHWKVGENQLITWTSSDAGDYVKLEYSTDGGNSWNLIVNSTANDGSYSWTIPNDPSEQCRVRITSVAHPEISDVSDTNFTIYTRSIKVSFPNGGEFWEVKSRHNIGWTGENIGNTVKIEYSSDGGMTWTSIVDSTGNDGLYFWTIPDDTSMHCLVKVTSTTYPQISDTSDDYFAIVPSTNAPPDTSITSAYVRSAKGTAEFTWAGSDDTTPVADLTYSYRLIRPGTKYDDWSPWSKGRTCTYAGLTTGSYKFEVRARDTNKPPAIDGSPASWKFSINIPAVQYCLGTGVYPKEGTTETHFYYTAIICGGYSSKPSLVRVNIDGKDYPMQFRYEDAIGLHYRYGPVNLSVGDHQYFFSCKLGNDWYFYPGEGQSLQEPLVQCSGLPDNLKDKARDVIDKFNEILDTAGRETSRKTIGFGADILKDEVFKHFSKLNEFLHTHFEWSDDQSIGAYYKGVKDSLDLQEIKVINLDDYADLFASALISEAQEQEASVAIGMVLDRGEQSVGDVLKGVYDPFIHRSELSNLMEDALGAFLMQPNCSATTGVDVANDILEESQLSMQTIYDTKVTPLLQFYDTLSQAKTAFSLAQIGSYIVLGAVVVVSGGTAAAPVVVAAGVVTEGFEGAKLGATIGQGLTLLSTWGTAPDFALTEALQGILAYETAALWASGIGERPTLEIVGLQVPKLIHFGEAAKGTLTLKNPSRTLTVRARPSVSVVSYSPDSPLGPFRLPLTYSDIDVELKPGEKKSIDLTILSPPLDFIKELFGSVFPPGQFLPLFLLAPRVMVISCKVDYGWLIPYGHVVTGPTEWSMVEPPAMTALEIYKDATATFVESARSLTLQETEGESTVFNVVLNVANCTDEPIRNVRVNDSIPEELSPFKLRFETPPSHVEAANHEFTWDISLKPHESKYLRYTFATPAVGVGDIYVLPGATVRYSDKDEVQTAKSSAVVDAVYARRVTINGIVVIPRSPVVDQQFQLVVEIENQGLTPAKDVAVIMGLPKSLTSSEDRSQVVSSIPAGGKVTLSWNVTATEAGKLPIQVRTQSPFSAGDVLGKVLEISPTERAGGDSGFQSAIFHGPNPVTDEGCVFWYDLPNGSATAKLMIFNVTGQPVFETALDVTSTRFPNTGTWNPVNQDGIPLANGPYVYVLIADGKVIGQGKMVIQR